MDDVLLVRRFDRVSDLNGQPQRLIGPDGAVRDTLGQRLAFDQLEDQELLRVGLLEAIDCRNIRVIEGRQHLRFALEAREAIGIAGKFDRQRLDRHVAPEPRVTSPPHFAHAALAERSGDGIWADMATGAERHVFADDIANVATSTALMAEASADP